MKRYIRSTTGSNSMSWSDRWRSANSFSTDAETMLMLADDRDADIRAAVAHHTKDPEVIAKLAGDRNLTVLKALIEANAEDSSLLAELSDHDNSYVRYEVARNTSDSNILSQLAYDDDDDVRAAVAERTDDPDLLAMYAKDSSPIVRSSIAERTDDPDLLAKFYKDHNVYIRYGLARNVNTDPEVLAKLANARDKDVREAALNNPSLPDSSKKAKSSWPIASFWYGLDSWNFDDAWEQYLRDPESEVNAELQIFPEPSTQGNMGGLYVFDESGANRNRDGDWYIDWNEYCDWQLDAAASSKNAEQYKKKYRKFMKELCGI